MGFWEIVKLICKIPLGVAAICGSVIVGMIAFIVCSLICYCFWAVRFAKENDNVFERWKALRDEEPEEFEGNKLR